MNVQRSILKTLLLLLLCGPWVCGLTGCASSAPAGEWVEREVATGNESLLVQTIQFSLDKQRFRVGAGLDTGRRRIETAWKEERQPFGGTRTRAIVEWQKIDSTRFRVRARVQQEDNDTSKRPLDPAHDKWKPLPDAPMKATAVLVTLKTRMGDYGIEINEPERPFTDVPDRR